MNDYKNNIIWKYILDPSKKEDILTILLDKYKGTAVECNPISFELTRLADAIVNSDSYTDATSFLNNLDNKIQENIYQVGLDIMLYNRDIGHVDIS